MPVRRRPADVTCVTVSRAPGPLRWAGLSAFRRDAVDLAVSSYATALAAIVAIAFALLLSAGRLLTRALRRRPAFLQTVANEPAERLRRRWQILGEMRALLLTSLTVFIIAAGTLIFAEPPVPAALEESWRQWLALAVTGIAALAVLARALLLTIERRRLGLRIDAGIAIAQSLGRITLNRNRVFHDVPTAFGSVDHVIAGLHGVYAVAVLAVPPARKGDLRLDGEELVFGDGRRRVPLARARRLSERFAREASKQLGQSVQVRLVVAVPGWDIAAQTAADLLIANERNISMLTGWKDERDYLMNEDVDSLQGWLDERCTRPG